MDNNEIIYDTSNNNVEIIEPTITPSTDGFYNLPITNTGGNPELIVDAKGERFIKGGKLTTTVANTLYKFKIQIAGTTEIYTDIGTYEMKDLTVLTINFEIFKTCRYVKVIILECSAQCDLKLEIY